MQNKQLTLSLLIVLGIGAMIGLGVFNIPSELAAEASAGVIIISWVINIIGIFSIVCVFRILSRKKRDKAGGLYVYSKSFVGEFGGTVVGYGYYACILFGVLSFFQSGMQSLSQIIPSMGTLPGTGMNLTQLLVSSILLWYLSVSMYKGILEISNTSLVATGFKIIPLILIIIVGVLSFDISNMVNDVQNNERFLDISSLHTQLRSTTKSILWLFVGFEGLSVISGRAYRNRDVGKAIFWSFVVVSMLYFLVVISCLGALPIDELAKLPPSSTGFVLERIIGKWGQFFIDFSMVVSVIGAILIWTMFGVEMIFLLSREKQCFDILGIEKDGVPKNAVLFTISLIQVLLILGYIFNINFRVFDSIMSTTVLVPYGMTILYCFIYVLNEEHYFDSTKRTRDIIVVLVAMCYLVWAVYSVGINLLKISAGVYTFAVILYIVNKVSRKETVFTKESAIASVVIASVGIMSMVSIIYKRF